MSLGCLCCERTKHGYPSFSMSFWFSSWKNTQLCLPDFKIIASSRLKKLGWNPRLKWINCTGGLPLNTEQFSTCYSCYRFGLTEFVLVHVKLHFGIKLLTRYISFSSFNKWREIRFSALASREGDEIGQPLLLLIRERQVWIEEWKVSTYQCREFKTTV